MKSRPSMIVSALLAAALLATGTTRADAPAPKPPAPAEAPKPAEAHQQPDAAVGPKAEEPSDAPSAPDAEAPKTAKPGAPSLKQLRAMDLSAALREAYRLAGLTGASAEKKELYAGLLLLNDRAEEARAILLELYPPRTLTDPAAALLAAAENLAEAIRKQPDRKRGTPYTDEEIKQRLQYALVAVACQQEKEAYAAVAPLGPCKGSGENLRLAILGLSAASADKREVGARAADDLFRRLSGDNQLGIRALTLVDSVQAYGVYTERATHTCRPGEELKAYCEILNFACRQLDPEPAAPEGAPQTAGTSYLTALDVDLTFLEEDAADSGKDRPPENKVILHSRGYAQVRHRTRSEIRDLHLVIRLRVPQQCTPKEGKSYWLKVTARDMATGKEGVSAAIPLNVE